MKSGTGFGESEPSTPAHLALEFKLHRTNMVNKADCELEISVR